MVLRRGRAWLGTWLAMAMFLALIMTSLASFRAVFDSEAAYQEFGRTQTPDESDAAKALTIAAKERFNLAHKASMRWNTYATLVLMGVVVGLVLELARRERQPGPA